MAFRSFGGPAQELKVSSITRDSQLEGQDRRSETLACCSFTRVPLPAALVALATAPGLLVALVVVAVAHRRLGPSPSATTSTVDRALSSSTLQLRCWSRPTRVAGWLATLAAGVGYASTVRPDPSTLGVVGERGSHYEGRLLPVVG